MDKVQFSINGAKFTAGTELSADTSLNEFIRNHADLRGTKYMCLEGGCGACVVNVKASCPNTHEIKTFSVNSCLVSVMSCDGWDITTIDGIGNRRIGYNIIQRRLNNFFGSQCGYCSPGFVMSMYSLLQNNSHLTEEEIENSFGSNLCRCTGYRPILEAFKSFAINPSPHIAKKLKDIEDLEKDVCPKTGVDCKGTCGRNSIEKEWFMVNIRQIFTNDDHPKKITFSDGRLWYTANNVNMIFNILKENEYKPYMLVAGNTAQGIYPVTFYPELLVDINAVKELHGHYLDVNLVLGANVTLMDTMAIFRQLYENNDDFFYLKIFYDHLDRVAHIPVRNVGTLAGNLMIKHKHPEFQSDIFLLLESVGTTLTIVDSDLREYELNLIQFLQTNMVGKIIKLIKLPPLSHRYKLVTYKVTPRAQNAIAYVNAAFLFKIDDVTNEIVEATIVYGGINSMFTHAYNTEKFLLRKNIFNNKVLQEALHCLDTEISPDFNPPEPSPYYRKKVALGLFYKCVIKLCPEKLIDSKYESGGSLIDRPAVSRSYQEYDTDKDEYPITQPVLKKEGLIQCAGEALYSDDIPTVKNEVFAALVLSTVTKGRIQSIDGSDALKLNGVFAVLTYKDIPGVNSIVRRDFNFMFENEEFLVSENVLYYNQPVAVVVAKTQKLADQGTTLVKVKYTHMSSKPAVFTIDQAINAPKEENRIYTYPPILPVDRGLNVKKIIKGKFYSPRQYHFTMELHNSVTIPVDDCFEIYSSSQYIDITQAAIANLLNIPESLIVVKTRRCGGGFGCKISRHMFAACATALVSKIFNRACRMRMSMPDIMSAIGKRPNNMFDYEVGVDDNGEIQYLEGKFYVNDGISRNENENPYVTSSLPNAYNSSRWKVYSYGVITDTPANCFMRAPGGFQAIAAIEHIMEHIATELQRDSVTVRLINMRRTDDNQLPELVPMFKKLVQYDEREDFVKKFNDHNRWKKRSIKLTNMLFPTQYDGNYGALVSVYHGDGSVIVSVGGTEIGQGLFTKVSQAAAKEFGISVGKVAVTPTLNFATPNNNATASSITTECCVLSVIRCCEQIKARLAPLQVSMPTATWQEVVAEADRRGILLQANYSTNENDPRLINYNIFGVAVMEVEIDVLTGTHYIVRADILEDTGRSINPRLDIGQIEGAFIQAVSLWTIENMVFDEKIGKILTNRSLNYKIIGAKDIPADFRVYLRKNAYNPVGILGSKAVGEPPGCMGQVVVHALRDAVVASRKDSAYDSQNFIFIDVPVTNESIVKAAKVRIDEFLLNS